MLRTRKCNAEEMFKKGYGHYGKCIYGHYFDYFIMIIKHSRYLKLCCYCLRINYSELIFLLSLPDSAFSSLKVQDRSITCLPPLLLLGEQLTDAGKWWYWRNRVGIFITNWLWIIHFWCFTSKEVSQISLWVQRGISPQLIPTSSLNMSPPSPPIPEVVRVQALSLCSMANDFRINWVLQDELLT